MNESQPEWMLHEEEKVHFWIHDTRRTLFTKQLVARRLKHARYQLFHIDRTWYSTITREFKRERQTVFTIEQFLARGQAVYDWRIAKMILPGDPE